MELEDIVKLSAACRVMNRKDMIDIDGPGSIRFGRSKARPAWGRQSDHDLMMIS